MERVKIVKNYVNEKIKHTKVDPEKDFESIRSNEKTHSNGTASLSKLLALKRGLDIEIAIIIGHIHDLGRIVKNVRGEGHGEACAIEVEKAMKELKIFSGEEEKIIIKAVRNHDMKFDMGGPYEELIKDADLLERFLTIPNYFDHEWNINKKNRIKRILEEINIDMVFK